MKALVVESNRKELDHIVMVINLYFPNIELITAYSGKQCMDMIKENSLGMVILGDLAEMPSFDVIEKIRGYSEVPIMVLSSINDKPVVVKAFDMGADGYMTKPFRQLELIAHVRSILRRKQVMFNKLISLKGGKTDER